MKTRIRRLQFAVLTISLLGAAGLCQPAQAAGADAATLGRIRDAGMKSDWAYQHLAEMTDSVGPRLSGSPGYDAAVQLLAAHMRALGAEVTLQPVKVPHWVRGLETAELTSYPGQPRGLIQKLHLTALGGSGATPAAGITARVVAVKDMAELTARAREVPGSIVVFTARFDQNMADNGLADVAYGQNGWYRRSGPSEAAKLGAVATLIRSVGGADFRLPHTGSTRFADDQKHSPSAALAAEDADMIARLAARGPVSLKLVLTPQILPDHDTFNVIADWKGRDKPDEIVLVSGHLDSWDLGTGAIDDGIGVYGSAGVIAVLKDLNLRARRTIRVVGYANEENGGAGGRAYLQAAGGAAAAATHAAVIESDSGAGRPLGFEAAVTTGSASQLEPLVDVLLPLGATAITRVDQRVGADIGPLQGVGIPGFGMKPDTRHYFDLHHTPADTFDKVDPVDMQAHVASLGVLAYFLAEMDTPLPRFTPSP
ncbi:MAG: M20/M25/M40 family metallo-hydrolase [Steroidobacteraceae bacterium]